MTTVGLVGAGYMGTGIGATLRAGGHEMLTTTAGRSARTVGLVTAAGITTVPDLSTLAAQADILLVVTPPAAGLDAAREIAAAARTAGAHPLVADLNAISPSTVDAVVAVLRGAGLDLVDGSISGAPPTVSDDTVIYLAGPRAAEVAALAWHPAIPMVVGDTIGKASAVKMCTASVYKGLEALLAQALRTAYRNGVLDIVLADLSRTDLGSHLDVAIAVSKAHRYVGEMREIAATQAAAGLSGDLFQAYAKIFEDLAETPLAAENPETLNRNLTATEVLAGLER